MSRVRAGWSYTGESSAHMNSKQTGFRIVYRYFLNRFNVYFPRTNSS